MDLEENFKDKLYMGSVKESTIPIFHLNKEDGDTGGLW